MYDQEAEQVRIEWVDALASLAKQYRLLINDIESDESDDTTVTLANDEV